MNIKTIIFGCVAVGVATGGILINKLQSTDQSVYNPRIAKKVLHKGSADYVDYMHSLKANQVTGEIDLAEYNRVKNQVLAISKQNNKAALGLAWANQGPDNVGGRLRAVLVDRNNPNLVYAGSVAGGLYVSTDGAGTWTPVGEMGDNLAISCITQTDNGRIFFGTGSTFDGAGGQIGFTPGFVGNGVYEYEPATGNILPVVVNTGVVPNNTENLTLSYVNAIGHKGDSLYIGYKQGLRVAGLDVTGKYPTDITDLNLWKNPIHIIPGNPLLENSRVQDIDVAADGSMVVCFSGKVYHSPNGAGDSFTRTSISGSRISAAIAESNPNYIFVVATNGTLNGLYLSNTFDAGGKPEFVTVVPGGIASMDPFRQNDGTGAQGTWDQCIEIDPNNPGRCIVGGIQLFEFNLVPTASPLAGDWLKIAHLSQQVGAPYYMHADKHTITWSGNTVYIGHDGGVSKSTDNGATWSTKNLGLNTATFFSVSTNALGWMLGGAQDNGNQLVSFGAFGGGSPLSAIEIQGGDGFDTEFSNLGSGMAFGTSQSGVLTRVSSASGGGGSLLAGDIANGANIFHTSISYWESAFDPLTRDSIKMTFDTNGTWISPGNKIFAGDTIFSGDTILYQSLTGGLDLIYITPANIITTAPLDSIYLADYIQHKMTYAFPDANAIYMTKQASNLGADISWLRIADPTSTPSAFSGVAYAMEFAPDGNSLFVGSSNGRVYRIDNLSMAADSLGLDIRSATSVVTCTQIGSFIGRNITGIAVDPNNGNNVIVTLGNYGNTAYIYRSTDALTSVSTTGFTSIQGPASVGTGYLPRMPIYDAEIDMTDNNTVVIGTEWGMWGSDNAFTASAAAVEWTEENTGIGHVPVFQVRQQTIRNLPTSGMMYLGSHGKGFFSSTDLVTGIDNLGDNFNSNKNEFVSDLSIYPNPLNTAGTITFNLKDKAKAIAKIYNLSGALVKSIDLGMLTKGDHKQQFDATTLSVGSYIVSIESGSEKSVAKFIVTR